MLSHIGLQRGIDVRVRRWGCAWIVLVLPACFHPFYDHPACGFGDTSRRAAGAGNLWYATRASAAVDFGPPQLVPSVNSDLDDGDPVLSADGCELYFASNRAGKYHLFRVRVMN